MTGLTGRGQWPASHAGYTDGEGVGEWGAERVLQEAERPAAGSRCCFTRQVHANEVVSMSNYNWKTV